MNENEIVSQAFVAKELFGIDPGKSNGGVVKYSDRYESWPLQKMASFNDLCDFWRYQAEICKMPLVFLEQITSFESDYEDKNNPKSKQYKGRAFQMNKLKDHYVELKSALRVSGITFIEVMPISWQKYISVYKPNEDYQVRKHRLKDIAKDHFSGNKVVGWNADAFLLIEFARKKLKYDQRWIIQKMKENKPKERKLWQ